MKPFEVPPHVETIVSSPESRHPVDGSPFPWFRSASLPEFAETVATRGESDPIPRVDRKALGKDAAEFHLRAGTLTEKVQHNLRLYITGVPSLRVAHQPNFLPSINVVAQAANCRRLNHLLDRRYAEVFFLLDYDTNDDRRYRRATLPSLLSPLGTWTVAAPQSQGGPVVMSSEPKPSSAFLASLVDAIHTWTGQQLALIPRHYRSRALRHQITESTAELEGILGAAGRVATSLADFNAIVLSWIVNIKLGLPTIFVPGSTALRSAADKIVDVWHHRELIHQLGQSAYGSAMGGADPHRRGMGPLWKRCACGRRLPLTRGRAASQYVFRCGCGESGHVDDNNAANLAANGELLPKVIADDLLDGYIWGNVAGCDYRGGEAHYRQSAVAAAGIGLPVLPVFLSARAPWADTDHLTGAGFQVAMKERGSHVAAELLTRGRASVVMPLLWGFPLTAKRLSDEMASSERLTTAQENE